MLTNILLASRLVKTKYNIIERSSRKQYSQFTSITQAIYISLDEGGTVQSTFLNIFFLS